MTSRISRLECRSKPTRDRDAALLARYEAAFARTRVVDVTAAIIERGDDRLDEARDVMSDYSKAIIIDGGLPRRLRGPRGLRRATARGRRCPVATREAPCAVGGDDRDRAIGKAAATYQESFARGQPARTRWELAPPYAGLEREQAIARRVERS